MSRYLIKATKGGLVELKDKRHTVTNHKLTFKQLLEVLRTKREWPLKIRKKNIGDSKYSKYLHQKSPTDLGGTWFELTKC
ncbi:hypothetical protein KKE78_01490 [Patescibacteria group bacterium]|nr:hypothetical protein [Patescibacteria group bacterium]